MKHIYAYISHCILKILSASSLFIRFNSYKDYFLRNSFQAFDSSYGEFDFPAELSSGLWFYL